MADLYGQSPAKLRRPGYALPPTPIYQDPGPAQPTSGVDVPAQPGMGVGYPQTGGITGGNYQPPSQPIGTGVGGSTGGNPYTGPSDPMPGNGGTIGLGYGMPSGSSAGGYAPGFASPEQVQQESNMRMQRHAAAQQRMGYGMPTKPWAPPGPAQPGDVGVNTGQAQKPQPQRKPVQGY